jgi:SAM-dependent methyltransferase
MREIFQPQWLHLRLLRQGLERALAELGGPGGDSGCGPRRLLDIGCGVRPYEPLARRAGYSYIGLDRPSPSSSAPRCDVIGSSLHLPFAEGSFDAVLSTQVLEHVPEPGRLLSEATRVLRPGGSLILTAPLTWPVHEAPNDFFRFTRFGLEYLAQQAGLEIVRLEALGGFWTLWGTRLAYRLRPRRSLRPPLDLLFGPPTALWLLVVYALFKLSPLPEETDNYLLWARKPA